MAFDERGRIAANRHGFDDVGIKRALREKFCLARALGRRLENFDERLADDFAFAFGIGDAFEPRKKNRRGVLVLQLDLEIARENVLHDFSLARPQHAVVDENAGELIADGLVQQRRRHAGIHAAAQAEDDVFLADLRADFLDGLLDVIAHRPAFAAAADAVDEIGDDFPAARRVDDFGMKLQAEKFLLAVFNRGELGVFRDGDGLETIGNFRELVAMGIPDLERLWQF